AGFRGDLQVLESVERPLEDVRELEQTTGGIDELTEHLEQRDGLQRRGERAKAAIGGHLALPGIHRELGPERHRAHAIATRTEVALDLDVPQHLLERAAIRREQGFVDLTALVRQLTAEHPGRRGFGRPRLLIQTLDELLPLLARDQKERMIADLHEQSR